MSRKRISTLLVFVLAFTFSLSGISYGATQAELEEELAGVEAEKEIVSARLAEVRAEIDELQPEVDAITAEVEEVDKNVAKISEKITDKKEEMKAREDGLNERLRVMYKNGSVGYIDVLLNSGSISELISNLDMLQLIFKNDMEVLNSLREDEKELSKIEKELKDEKKILDSKKAELDSRMAELNALKSELEYAEDKFLEEAQELAAQIKNMTNPDTEYVGGTYVWPTPSSKYITSQFGWRIHPLFNTWKYHSGTDIGASYGTDILACASGTVILSQEYGGYGECIIIDHGGGITSLYGHMSERLVSVGETVSGGELIGLVGSSGWSDGPHLHLEFTLNGELVDPLDYIKTDGLIYIY